MEPSPCRRCPPRIELLNIFYEHHSCGSPNSSFLKRIFSSTMGEIQSKKKKKERKQGELGNIILAKTHSPNIMSISLDSWNKQTVTNETEGKCNQNRHREPLCQFCRCHRSYWIRKMTSLFLYTRRHPIGNPYATSIVTLHYHADVAEFPFCLVSLLSLLQPCTNVTASHDVAVRTSQSLPEHSDDIELK